MRKKSIKLDRDFEIIVKENDMALQELAMAEQTGGGQAFLLAADCKMKRVRDKYETNPKRCPEKLEDDVIWQLGYVAALKYILSLPIKAKENLNRLPEGEYHGSNRIS